MVGSYFCPGTSPLLTRHWLMENVPKVAPERLSIAARCSNRHSKALNKNVSKVHTRTWHFLMWLRVRSRSAPRSKSSVLRLRATETAKLVFPSAQTAPEYLHASVNQCQMLLHAKPHHLKFWKCDMETKGHNYLPAKFCSSIPEYFLFPRCLMIAIRMYNESSSCILCTVYCVETSIRKK